MGHSRSLSRTTFRDEADAIDAALRADAERLFSMLFGKPDPATTRGPEWKFPGHGGLYAVVRSSGRKKRGAWFLHGQKKGGGPIGAIMFIHGCSFSEALAIARSFLGLAAGTSMPALSAEARAKREIEAAQAAAQEWAEYRKGVGEARKIWAQTVPIAETLGERYLRDTRRITAAAEFPPTAVRWHAGRRAVVLAATNDAGEIEAIQLIQVGPDGNKLTDPAALRAARAPATKWTRGPIGRGAVVRLPGDAGGPLQVAEGPETGLTVWAANGCETWVTLGVGGMAKVIAPADRVLVVCRDDDAKGSEGEKQLRRAVAAYRQAGAAPRLASPFEVRRHNGNDFNTLAIESGLEAVGDRIDAALNGLRVKPGVPAAVASAIVETAIVGFYDEAFAWSTLEDDEAEASADLVKATVGVSKSTFMRKHGVPFMRRLRASGSKRNMAIAVPRHELGDDQRAALQAICGDEFVVRVRRGRGAADQERPGHNMCDREDAIADAREAGADPRSSVCVTGHGTEQVTCPFASVCGSERQRAERADIWLVAHESLFHMRPHELRELAVVVVDEAVWQKGLHGAKMEADGSHPAGLTLSVDALGYADKRPGDENSPDWHTIQHHRSRVVEALRDELDGPLRRDALDFLTRAEAGEAEILAYARKRDAKLNPAMSRAERRAVVEASSGNRVAMLEGRFWGEVVALKAEDGPEASGHIHLATVPGPNGSQRVLHLRGRSEVATGWRVPTLLLDAHANVDLLRPYWPKLRVIADVVASAPHQRVRQITDRSFAKSQLEQLDATVAEKRPEIAKSRKKALRNVRDMLAREARSTSTGRMLAITQLAAEKGLREMGVRPGIELAHHNNVAGLDRWRDVERLVVVGRTLPRPQDVERMAEALTGEAVPRQDYVRVAATRTVRGRAVPCEAMRHPHPVAEAARWQICEGEILQNGGRGRGVWRTAENPLDVLLATDVPLPEIDIDEELSAANLISSPAEQMLGEGGIAFANPTHAAAAYPDLWAGRDTAKDAFRRWRLGGFPNEKSIHLETHPTSPLVRVRYQVAGAGQTVVEAAVDLAVHLDPRAALERLLAGVGPLARFEIVGAPEPDPPAVVEPAIDAPELEQVDEDEEAAAATRHLAAERRRQGLEPVFEPGRPLFADIAPRAEEIARLIAEAPRMVVEPSGPGEPLPVAWSPPASAFAAPPGASDRDRLLLDLASLLPWSTLLPPGVPGPPGWIPAMPCGP